MFEDLIDIIVRSQPYLKSYLRVAHSNYTPAQFVKKSLILTAYTFIGILAALLLFFSGVGIPVLLAIPVALILGIISFFIILQSPLSEKRKREREINKEVLFAGRFLLVKLESGAPLFNALTDAAKSYGVAGKYFKEIVDDINTGTTIEEALENARKYNASEKFKRILWQISSSLKTGVDITDSLKSTLRGIAVEQTIEIKEYGRKLNSLMLFYMVVACVGPSLGVTMFIILSGFLSLEVQIVQFFLILFILTILQVTFVVLIRSIRPLVNV